LQSSLLRTGLTLPLRLEQGKKPFIFKNLKAAKRGLEAPDTSLQGCGGGQQALS